jgi:hypothetical protein
MLMMMANKSSEDKTVAVAGFPCIPAIRPGSLIWTYPSPSTALLLHYRPGRGRSCSTSVDATSACRTGATRWGRLRREGPNAHFVYVGAAISGGGHVIRGGRRHATKRHGARWSQVRLPRPVLYDGYSLRLLRRTLPADRDMALSEAGGTKPLQVQVDGSRRVFGPLFLVSRRLFLTLAGNGEAGHDGCDGDETDTQGTNRRLPR